MLRSSDAKNWIVLGEVEANGESKKSVVYHFIDPLPLTGLNYYRLKMVDNDGAYSYSRITSVSHTGQSAIVYPNPVKDGEPLRLNLAKSVEKITVFNFSGMVIYQNDLNLDSIDLKGLQSGQYILKIIYKDGTENSQTFLKK